MARFLFPGTTKGETFNVVKKPITYLCIFKLPEEIIDTRPYAELAGLTGCYTLRFYDRVSAGDRINYKGHIWEAIARTHYPYRPNARGTKKVSEIEFRYVSRAGD